MSYATLRMHGKEFVLVPKRRVCAADGTGSKRCAKGKAGVAATAAGKLRTISHADLKRELGL